MTEERTGAAARIIDRGYQHYTGPRLGLNHALWTMLRGALGRGMGIRRPARAKILPWLLMVPVMAYAVIRLVSLSQGNGALASPMDYPTMLGRVALIFFLFSALVSADLLCPDRRERVLSLYFASPITRLQYAGAQVLGVAMLMLGLSLLPALVLFFGQAVLSSSAAGYVGDHTHDLAHIFVAGLLIALFYSTLACAVASFTDRRAYAVGAFLGLILVGAAAGNIIAVGITFPNHQDCILLDLSNLPIHAARWLWDPSLTPTNPENKAQVAIAQLSGWSYLGASLGLIAVSVALMGWQYLRIRE